MEENEVSLAYGPVPSRRLGRSIGINNIPPKVCSYSCIYCQLGVTRNMEVERRRFYGPERIFNEVREQVESVEKQGGRIDHLTFVPDGEPTLDIDLGREIGLVRTLSYPVAVITNSSHLGDEKVREEISEADLVSVKVDSVDEGIWRKVNRPHRALELQGILDGLREFSRTFRGSLITETMLVKGVNDSEDTLGGTTDLIVELDPRIAYITVPIRPPSEGWVEMPSEGAVQRAIELFVSKGIRTVPLTEKEYGDFTYTGDVERDIMAITSVHPMREDSIMDMLNRSGESWDIVEGLVSNEKITVSEYEGVRFYRRRFEKV